MAGDVITKDTNKGMPQYTVSLLRVSLTVADVPLGYTPPVGPKVEFRLTYIERDTYKSGPFSYSNLGNQWSHEWMCYIADDTTTPNADVKVILDNGGAHTYCFRRQHPDLRRSAEKPGTVGENLRHQLSNHLHGWLPGQSFPCRTARMAPGGCFLTQKIDPAGNALTYNYDSNYRLVAVQDAIGQVTTLSYELASDPLKITRVTDPFGRYATFQYNGSGHSPISRMFSAFPPVWLTELTVKTTLSTP